MYVEGDHSHLMYQTQETVLSEMIKSSPSLLELTDPYLGYSAVHWAAKVDSLDT